MLYLRDIKGSIYTKQSTVYRKTLTMSEPDQELTIEIQDTNFLISPCTDSPIPSPRRVLNSLDLLAVNDCVNAKSVISSANSTRSSSLSSLNSEAIFEQENEDEENDDHEVHHEKVKKKIHKKKLEAPIIINETESGDRIEFEEQVVDERDEKLPD